MTSSVPSWFLLDGTDISHNLFLGGYCARRIENSLHFIKDRWWDEDRHWTSRPGLAERLASLRDAALNVLRLPGVFAEDLPIRGRADHLGRFPEKALKLIGALE
jgi:hypothetical protein